MTREHCSESSCPVRPAILIATYRSHWLISLLYIMSTMLLKASFSHLHPMNSNQSDPNPNLIGFRSENPNPMQNTTG